MDTVFEAKNNPLNTSLLFMKVWKTKHISHYGYNFIQAVAIERTCISGDYLKENKGGLGFIEASK